jgi:hypothetical protein
MLIRATATAGMVKSQQEFFNSIDREATKDNYGKIFTYFMKFCKMNS